MPSVMPKKKDLYLGKCLGDLHKMSDVNQLGNNVNIIVKSSTKVFQDAQMHDSLGDEEKSFVLYMKYFNILQQIKQKADYRKQKQYFDNLIGGQNQKKAIIRAESLSASLKERYDLKEAEALAKRLAPITTNDTIPASKTTASTGPDEDPGGNTKKAVEVETLPKAEGSITCSGLCSLLRDMSTKVIVMDVRGAEDFTQSHISHTECISVPESILEPGSTVAHIQSKLPSESASVWHQRKHADFLILLDWSSCLDQVKIGSPLKTLKDALFKFDTSSMIKSEPLILEGGYEKWLLFYPTMTTNAHVSRPSDKKVERVPSPTMTLDFEYPELDENLEKIVPVPAKNESQTVPTGLASVVTDASMPRIDRSLKPSASQSSGLALNQTEGLVLNNNVSKDKVSRDNLYPSFEAIATKPMVNKNGVKNTNLPGNNLVAADGLNLEPKKIALSVRNDLASDLVQSTVSREEKESELKDFQTARNRQLDEDQRRIEEAEKKLRDLEFMKKREEKDVADLMRMKRKLAAEVETEKQRKAEDQERFEIEEQRRMLSVEKAKREEAEKKRRLAEVEKMRQERKKAEVEKEEKRLEEDEEEERQWEATQEALRHQREEQEEHKAKMQLEQERELAKLEEEKKAAEKLMEEQLREREREEERRKEEEAARKAEQLEKQAKEAQEAARLQKLQQEAAKAEAEKRRKEQMAQELEQKKKLFKEQKKAEDEAAQRAAKEKEAMENQKLQSENASVSSKTVPSNMLPAGWEKRLDLTTNRYFYIDHNRSVTQWNSPAMPSSAKLKGTYTTALREEPSVSSSRGLSRSHSSPNIKKQLEEEEEKARKIAPLPSINRGAKPVARTLNVAAKQTAHSLRKRDLNPIYGDVGPALTGLRNLGNTCYMNSTVQCLNNTSPLVSYILNDSYVLDVNRESSQGMYGEVVDDFAVVVKALWSQQYRSITPRDLKAVVAKYNPMFAGYQQQDSQEFLTFLLDGLHEGLNEVKQAPDIPEQNNDGIPEREAAGIAWKHHKMLHRSIIVELFQGQLKSSLRCGTCTKTSVTFQAFMFLSLPIPASSKCTLQDCIRAFLKPEMMTGSSRWKCPRCKVERDSEKKIEIWKLPHILLVGLNRFYSEGMWMQKKSTYVDFPVNDLDLSPYIIGPPPRNHYSLYGISNHYGTMEGGHYTAFCRNPVDKKWHKFDDQDVYGISTSDVKTSAAFVLYYTSIDMQAPKYVPRL